MFTRPVPLFKIFNIQIELDLSWFLIFALVTWNLAGLVFPEFHPQWSPVLNWTLGSLASILFFASVLAHELGHALAAKAQGLPIERITLFVFGGVAHMEEEPKTPKVEFIMAAAGPLVSLIIGAVLLSLTAAMAAPSTPPAATAAQIIGGLGPLATMAVWLGTINITVGLFNLIPGFPLDGGRILRSILWKLTGNLKTATRWSSLMGQGLAFTFIGLGIIMLTGREVPVLGGGIINAIWLMAIGWFLNNAAKQGYQVVVMNQALEGVKVHQLMNRDWQPVPAGLNLSQLVESYLLKNHRYHFPVLNRQKEIVGLIRYKDLEPVNRGQWDQTLVKDIMTPLTPALAVKPHDSVGQIFRTLIRSGHNLVPVVERGVLVGLLSLRDVLLWLKANLGKTELAAS